MPSSVENIYEQYIRPLSRDQQRLLLDVLREELVQTQRQSRNLLEPTARVRGFNHRNLTLKAFANSSPGLALKPWDHDSNEQTRNSEGVASPLR